MLRGNLAPRGCVMKPAAAEQRFLKHRGKAIAFEDYNHMAREVERDDLDVTPDHVLVLKNAGPKGGPGMPEWGMLPIPKQAAAAGRARHGAHLGRAHERHELRRVHPACRARELRRRPAGVRPDRRRDRDRRRQAPHPSARQRRGAGAPPRGVDAAAAAISSAATARCSPSTSARPTRAATSISCRARRKTAEPEIH